MAKADQMRANEQGDQVARPFPGSCKQAKRTAPKCAWCRSHGGNKQEFIQYAMSKAVYIGRKEATEIFDAVCTPPAGGNTGGNTGGDAGGKGLAAPRP